MREALQDYAALRYGGASASRASLELGLTAGEGLQLERLFSVRHPGKAARLMRPAADHQLLVDHVVGEGGYPVLQRAA